MAACGRLQHIFEKPLPESPKILESLSLSPWKQIQSVDSSSSSSCCRDFFEELHFEEHHHHHHDVESSSFSSSSPSPSPLSPDHSSYPTTPVPCYSFFEGVLHPGTDDHKDDNQNQSKNERGRNPATTTTTRSSSSSSYCPIKQYRHSDSFSSMNSESLSLCTEGLGFESSDDVEDMISNEPSFDFYNHHHNNEEKTQPQTQGFSRNVQSAENSCNKESKRATNNKGPFPPPISCIGRTGKPWVSFKSFREDGRFILQEIRIPTQEFLHACREDGRLRLQLIHSDDEIPEEEEEEEETETESESESESESEVEETESEEEETGEETEEEHDDDIQKMKEENEENKETDDTEI